MARSPSQTLLNLYVNDRFLELIDTVLPELGYANRSEFIRSAIREKLQANGLKIAPSLSAAPNRIGKGGRPRRVNSQGTTDPVKDALAKIEHAHRERVLLESTTEPAVPPARSTSPEPTV
jgi:Arc/MetJ-type ribon-helix-helix transcriptional regulator